MYCWFRLPGERAAGPARQVKQRRLNVEVVSFISVGDARVTVFWRDSLEHHVYLHVWGNRDTGSAAEWRPCTAPHSRALGTHGPSLPRRPWHSLKPCRVIHLTLHVTYNSLVGAITQVRATQKHETTASDAASSCSWYAWEHSYVCWKRKVQRNAYKCRKWTTIILDH